MNNVVYVSGTHGSGKSTLIKKLAEKDPELFVMYKRLVLPQKFKDLHRRQKIRMARYYLQAHYLDGISKEKPDKVILCDRCSYDNLAYIKGFLNLGWVSAQEFEDYIRMHDFLIAGNLKPKNVIFLNPSLEEVICNLKKRWADTGKKKWREDDFDYLTAVKEGFKDVYSGLDANVLEVKVMDIDKRVSESYSWIKKVT
ncbi:MAG: AAA family ATPase [Nanoarchaeota archaeon]|nr:AAA family ATPase [Nanoarchaeota archaeon]